VVESENTIAEVQDTSAAAESEAGADLETGAEAAAETVSEQPVVSGQTGSQATRQRVEPQTQKPSQQPLELRSGAPEEAPAVAAAPKRAEEPPPPLPTGVAVVGVGERLLAGEAEAVIERAFTRHAITLVDEAGVAGVLDLVSSGERRAGVLMETLKPHARYLVLAHAEYLGERPITYMGRRDVAFQARLHVVAFDLATGGGVGQGLNTKIDYTHLNVERKVAEALRPAARRLAVQVKGD
jgi:hypothetical protein